MGNLSTEYPDLIGWTFTVVEVSSNVYKVTGKEKSGLTVESTGLEPDQLLEQCRQYALDIVSQLRKRAKSQE